MNRYACLGLALASSLFATLAFAQSSHVGAALSFHEQSHLTAFGITLDGGAKIGSGAQLDAWLPLAVGSAPGFSSSETHTEAAVGNPMLAMLHVVNWDRGSYSIGGALTLPISDVGDVSSSNPSAADAAVAKVLVQGLVWASYGERDPWLWIPDYFSLVVPFNVDYRSDSHVLVLADAAFALMFPVRDRADAGGSSVDVAIQARLGVGGTTEHFDAGLALGVAALPTVKGISDKAQSALEPFIRVRASGGAYFESRLTINLDHELGFAFDTGRVWGLHVGGGMRF